MSTGRAGPRGSGPRGSGLRGSGLRGSGPRESGLRGAGLRGAEVRAPDLLRIVGGAPLRGAIEVPGDKSISHRALLLGALGEGTSIVSGVSRARDVHDTTVAIEAMGAEVHDDGVVVTVTGGRACLRPPAAPVWCGNSGTTMRLLSGVLAGLRGASTLHGDASLSLRPMDRVAVPLRAMGADVEGEGERSCPPLRITGSSLRGIEWTPPVASAQVKSAVLLAGLFAEGETVVHEPVRTRTNTEDLLLAAGADIDITDVGPSRTVRLRGPSQGISPIELHVPGDPSQAAFWVVAGAIVPGSEVTIRGLYAAPERTGFLGVLERMGALLETTRTGGGDNASHTAGETLDATVRAGPLRATEVDATEIPSLDEVPILAVAAAVADGTSFFRGVGELRVKETDRLAAVSELVEAMGASAKVVGDDLSVVGFGGGSRPARSRPVHSYSSGDHRMAMAAAVAALSSEPGDGESRLEGFDAVATSYPAFQQDLLRLGGHARLRLIAIDGPAGSGKSTVSRVLAERLGLPRLDTGAMYRAVAWAALDRGVDPADHVRVADIAHAAEIDPGPPDVHIDGVVVTDAIREPGVNHAVSVVAANPLVRSALVERQRAWRTAHGGGVVEGRDIGSVVFPDADLKVFLTASPEVRARRRQEEEHVARRDAIDASRSASPMVAAQDARVADTSTRTVAEVIDEIVSWLT